MRGFRESHGGVPRAGWLTWRVAVFCIVLAFFGWGQRALWESSEGRYGEVGREMLASGDWLVPSLAGHAHLTKPPLTYWAIAGGMKILGTNEWGARLFLSLAFLGTILCVGELAWAGGFDRRQALASALVYGTGAMTFVGGRVLTTDGFLVFWETLGVLAAWKVWWGGQASRGRWRWVFWFAFGMAFLTKGPPGWLPLLAIVGFLMLRRGRPRPRLFAILPVMLFLVLSFWWYLVLVLRQPELIEYFLKDELIDRVATEEHKRDAPFYSYFPVLLLGLGPWIALWPRVLSRVRDNWRAGWQRLPDWQLFCVLWVVLPLSVFLVSQSRMPLYVLPLFVPMCLAFGRVVPSVLTPLLEGSTLWRRGIVAAALVWLAVLAIASVYPDGWPGEKSDRREGLVFREVLEKIPGEKRLFYYEMRPRHSLAFYMRHTINDVDLDDDEFREIEEKPGESVVVLYMIKSERIDDLEEEGAAVHVLARAGEYAMVEVTD